ncbi:hypothetical protein HDE_01188 [Halotydeus destructor]|nr:hypothetical protein HDE_01188 [Halotydeus destructor]
MRLRKSHVLITLPICATYLFLYVYFRGDRASDLRIQYGGHFESFDELYYSWRGLVQSCPALQVDPFDPAMKEVVEEKKLECPFSEPMTVLKGNRLLTVWNLSRNVECYFSHLKRDMSRERSNEYTEAELIPSTGITFTEEEMADAVNTSCWNNGHLVYENVHLNWNISFEARKQKLKAMPSVLIMIVESVSTIDFHNQMPKTKEQMSRIGNFTTLKNFVKIDDNSFPNLITMLTGRHVGYKEAREMSKEYLDEKFDYIWNYYRDKGYVTGFTEDMAQIGLFNFNKGGFQEQPVDWYTHAYWVHMFPRKERSKVKIYLSNKTTYCYSQNGRKVDLFYDQIEKFIEKQSNERRPFFLFSIYSQITHEDSNSIRFLDEPISKLLANSDGWLNDTIIILAGDHGPRIDRGYVQTAMGRLRERMPLFSIRLPETLVQEHAHLQSYLDANHDRLISWYDVHQLLKDVATENYEPLEFTEDKKKPISILRELVPPARTCTDAGVLDGYCVCKNKIHLHTEIDAEIFPSVKFLIQHLNQLLTKHGCHRNVTDHKVLEAHYIVPSIDDNFIREKLFLKITALPADVTVEGIVQRNLSTKDNQRQVHVNEMSTREKQDLDRLWTRKLCHHQ